MRVKKLLKLADKQQVVRIYYGEEGSWETYNSTKIAIEEFGDRKVKTFWTGQYFQKGVPTHCLCIQVKNE